MRSPRLSPRVAAVGALGATVLAALAIVVGSVASAGAADPLATPASTTAR